MKISIKPQLYEDSNNVVSMSDVKEKSGLNYATVLKLVKGTFAPQTFRVLADYLAALGHKAADITEMKVKDIFDVRD